MFKQLTFKLITVLFSSILLIEFVQHFNTSSSQFQTIQASTVQPHQYLSHIADTNVYNIDSLSTTSLTIDFANLLTEYKQRVAQERANHIRAELVNSVNDYIVANFPESKLSAEALVDACTEHNFDICFALAQAEIESHLGTKGIAASTNSPWNVGAFDGLSSSQIKKRGHGYKHPDHAIEPYILLVRNKYLGESKSFDDLMKNYVSLSGHRYASNPKYESRLSLKYRYIRESTNINNLQEEFLRIS